MAATGLDNAEFLSNDSRIYKVHGCSQPISVKVSDYNYGNINPSPIKLPKDTELLEEFLSPRKLQALTGVDNLETVEFLEMRVNTDQMSLGNFGMYLPNLTQIKLSGSYIPTIRDLGTSLWNLQVLWMPQCCLHCLDGLVTMSNLKELYLAYNEIEDISSCGMLENLEILDLEGNQIEDDTSLHYLSMCPILTRMTLDGNPLCNPGKYERPMTYRGSIVGLVPQLQFLDDIPVLSDCKNPAAGDDINLGLIPDVVEHNATLEFEDHWKFINLMLLESGLLAESSRIKENISPRTPDYDSGRPSSSSVTSARPCSAMRPMSAQRQGLNSALGRPGTATIQRPTSGISQDSCHNESIDDPELYDDSSLTAGRVVCGSITKSLRRQSEQQSCNTTRMKVGTENRPKTGLATVTCQQSDNSDLNIDESCKLVLQELSEWRQDYEKSKARIEQQKAAQTLVIECADEDIETVIITNKPWATEAQIEEQTFHDKKKQKSDIKLNPIRNGKLPPQSAPRIPSNEHKTMDGNNNLLKKCTIPDSNPVYSAVTSNQPSQMSRIRRQLLQSGATSITPSKPLLKR